MISAEDFVEYVLSMSNKCGTREEVAKVVLSHSSGLDRLLTPSQAQELLRAFGLKPVDFFVGAQER